MSQPISKDTQLLRLDGRLHELQEQRRQTRPALQFLFAFFFAAVFILFVAGNQGFPSILAIAAGMVPPITAIAGILAIGAGVVAPLAAIAGILALVKASKLDGEIQKVKDQIRQLEEI